MPSSLEASSLKAGSRSVVMPVGPVVIAVFGLEVPIERATTETAALPCSASVAEPSQAASTPPGAAMVLAVRWPERCVTPKRNSPAAWPATFRVLHVLTSPSIAGLAVVRPVVEPGM